MGSQISHNHHHHDHKEECNKNEPGKFKEKSHSNKHNEHEVKGQCCMFVTCLFSMILISNFINLMNSGVISGSLPLKDLRDKCPEKIYGKHEHSSKRKEASSKHEGNKKSHSHHHDGKSPSESCKHHPEKSSKKSPSHKKSFKDHPTKSQDHHKHSSKEHDDKGPMERSDILKKDDVKIDKKDGKVTSVYYKGGGFIKALSVHGEKSKDQPPTKTHEHEKHSAEGSGKGHK